MPTIHTKTKWLHGPGDVLTYQRNPEHYYLRVGIPGTKRYKTERIVNAHNLDDAQTEAIACYARLLQRPLQGPTADTYQEIGVTTFTNKRTSSRSIQECVKEFLTLEQQRFEVGEITYYTYKQRKQSLECHLLPYLSSLRVSHSNQLKNTTFDNYNYYRRTTSKSKITRNNELRAFKYFFINYLLKRKLIDSELLMSPGFLPYQTIRGEDLDGNPAINDEDWRLITDEIHRYVAEGKKNTNYRVRFFRTLFWSFCLVMKNTGIRPGELLRLKWKHIEFATEEKPNGSLRYVAHITLPAPITKTRVAREVPTAGGGGDRLMAWLEYLQDFTDSKNFRRPKQNDLVFGCPHLDWKVPDYTSLSKAWTKIKKPLLDKLKGHKFSDRPYTIYSMRSTFIENRLMDRVDVWLISRWCGHSVDMLMKHYERLDVRNRSDEATKIEYGKKKQVDATIKAEDYL